MSISMQAIFARFVAIIMGILAIFNGGNMENINLGLKNEVTTKTEIIEVQVFNYTGKKLTADEQFYVEKNENGTWIKLDFYGDYAVNDITTYINNLQTVTFNINVIEAFGKTFDEGEYRLTKSFCPDADGSLIFTVIAE